MKDTILQLVSCPVGGIAKLVILLFLMKEMIMISTASEDNFNDIDELMALDPLELSQQNLDRIIAYQRKHRLLREQGVKPKKASGEAKPAVDLSELLAGLKPTQKPTISARRR